ncbi:hypothetical protein AAZV13_05G081700 [Glycine max]
MAILQLHRIQHSVCVLLVFLIHFSSLQFPSHGYTVPDKYFNNCGSDSSASKSGKNYVGESNLKTSFGSSNTERSESQVPSPLYQTAKKFRSEASGYKFNINVAPTCNLSSASFNVSVPGFWLLRNFNGRNDSDNNSAVVKEFFMQITSGSFKITFRPLPSSFAFVNAIELFILPIHLTANQVSRFTYSGNTSLDPLSGGLYSRVLETKHRLNVDDSYILNTENAKNRSPYLGPIQYRVGNDSDGSNANEYTAPSDVYGTAKEINSSSSSAGNITWALLVDNNADHLLRLHFCDYWSPQNDLKYFDLSIYDTYVMSVNIDNQELPAPYYYDFVVHSDDSGFMKVSIAPDASAPIPNAFLNGLEIMKVIMTSSSVPLDQEPYSNHNSLPVVLGSVIGGLVVVFAVVILGFLWRFKMRKEKPVENSDWLPIPITAGGSSHGRLTDGTSHGSPLPNISLRLKSPLIDLQLATKNFHASQLIGEGDFGNVYKGVLRNGIIFAVKRSQPGSVSLSGYCDERFEMILVYEYMEKGTLRDHLYNTKLPSLPWKQRLEICIGASRGFHYLHKGASRGIIHPENLVAKVADFGLSRSGPLDTQPYVSTGVKGTFGYLDPEYFRSQQLTEKSDVYSFGVVLLKVLCARAPINPLLPRDQINLAEWGMLCKNKGILLMTAEWRRKKDDWRRHFKEKMSQEEIIDPSIKAQIDQNSLRKFSDTVEKCLQEDGSDRPSMDDVLWDLGYALQLQRGANAIHKVQHEDSSSSVSASFQLPNVRHLPSFSTLSEADDSVVRGDKSNSAEDFVFSQLKMEDAR